MITPNYSMEKVAKATPPEENKAMLGKLIIGGVVLTCVAATPDTCPSKALPSLVGTDMSMVFQFGLIGCLTNNNEPPAAPFTTVAIPNTTELAVGVMAGKITLLVFA